MKDFTLPSGAVLQVQIAPFADADTLLKAILEEAKGVNLNGKTDVFALCKEVICYGLSSRNIERSLKKCMERALYNKTKITDQTFEPEEARQDYIEVLLKVTEVNVRPFTKNLSATLSAFMELISSSQA